MTTRTLLAVAAAVAALSTSAAFAADMPGSYPRVVYAAPAGKCSTVYGRPADRGLLAPQPAYIVASSCADQSLSAWLKNVGLFRRENLRVYYNGHSMWRTDITTIDVPIQPQVH